MSNPKKPKMSITVVSDFSGAIDPRALKTRGKFIHVTCRGAATAKLEDLHPLQGELKSLSDESYEKLKRSILKHGVSFPFFAWEYRKKLYVLDGHQRDRALHRLQDAGYKIPPLPIDYIEAANRKEAAEKILLLSSQYGKMTEDSLEDFLKENDLNLADLIPTVELPGIDVEELLESISKTNGKEDEIATLEYRITVECKGKKDQKAKMDRLKQMGYKCRGSQAGA